MADQKSREERERAWHAEWRAADFSWDGLAKKGWGGWAVAPDGAVIEREGAPEGSRPATLQDYWRDEVAHLIEGDGKLWTRAHCPLAWEDGNPTPKANWGEAERATLEALFSTKLGAAAETQFKYGELIGADRRAQFQGCILFGAPAHPDGEGAALSVRFDRAQFSGAARFFSAQFSGDAWFNSAQFSGDAWFESAQFRRKLAFQHAVFSRPTFFRLVSFPEAPDLFSAAFRGARFADVADFTQSGAEMVAAFDEAMFEKKLLLDDPDERSANREFHRAMLPLAEKLRDDPAKALESDAERRRERGGEAAKPLQGWEKRRVRLAALDRGLKELEGGCRVVKVAMGRERDEQMEQRYYRYQLIARRQQRGTPLAEKFYSTLYGGFSDYGMGLWQPFVTLLVMVFGFAALYWSWGVALQQEAACFGAACRIDPHFWDAMLLSANNVFRPFGVWGSSFEWGDDGRWIPSFLNAFSENGEGGWMRLLIRLVASVQSLLSVILFFLFGLAVRRRFQIG